MMTFGPDKKTWNDGPEFVDFMGREGAPPVATRHLCYGGGGGGSTPQAPDMSDYIGAMTKIGNDLTAKGGTMWDWAQKSGADLKTIADKVSGRSGTMADAIAGKDAYLMGRWEDLYGPIYEAQAADAARAIKNLPLVEEQYAGRYMADTAQAFDAAKSAEARKLQGQGLKMPGGPGGAALDMITANQRAAALSSAGETGRMTADTTARQVATNALNTGLQLPQVGTSQGNLALAAGQQEFGTPAAAITTTAGAYSPSLGYYQGAYPYMGQWGSTMSNTYNQQLAAWNAQQNAGGGMGALAGAALGAIGTIGGAYLGGPAGAAVGGAAGKAAGSAVAATGGMIPEMARGGAPAGPHYVSPSASPSRGAITDDVPARLNAGEFVFPKDVVAWRGEAWMQKEIQKARQERQQKEVAKPTMKPDGAIHATPPRFRSEGARA